MKEIDYQTHGAGMNPIILAVGFSKLSYDFVGEKHLLWKSPFELARQFTRRRSVIACDGPIIVAHVTLWPLVEGWSECGSLFVHPRYRGQGIGLALLRQVVLRHEGTVILTTTNPKVQQFSLSAGFRLMRFCELPAQIIRATCSCAKAKTQSVDPRGCCLKDKACRLFIC